MSDLRKQIFFAISDPGHAGEGYRGERTLTEWQVDAVMRVVEAEFARSGWQPIETAPKDGTEVLGFRSGRVKIIWWDDDKYLKKPAPFWSGTDAQLLGKIWARQNPPTLWMPLPAKPEAA